MLNNFTLQIVSKLPQFNGQVMRPYFVDGVDTIGVWGNEPFELRFKNPTGQKVQIRLSLDGTDILTGKLAHTDVTNDGMWVVQAYGEMTLKAWPETNQKGREFVFTHEGLSVASHTHGNMEHKGIIAAAVFTETHTPRYDRFWLDQDQYFYGDRARVERWDGKLGNTSIGSTMDSAPVLSFNGNSKSAVGAGQEVMQKIGQTQGLVRPKLDRVIRVRHVWWSDLEDKLKNNNYNYSVHASGFPGDAERKLLDLSKVPSVGTKRDESFDRFLRV